MIVTEREREREREAETQAEGETGSMHREPDVGFDPGSPGSRPGSKASAKPLRHPGIPRIQFLPDFDNLKELFLYFIFWPEFIFWGRLVQLNLFLYYQRCTFQKINCCIKTPYIHPDSMYLPPNMSLSR